MNKVLSRIKEKKGVKASFHEEVEAKPTDSKIRNEKGEGIKDIITTTQVCRETIRVNGSSAISLVRREFWRALYFWWTSRESGIISRLRQTIGTQRGPPGLIVRRGGALSNLVVMRDLVLRKHPGRVGTERRAREGRYRRRGILTIDFLGREKETGEMRPYLKLSLFGGGLGGKSKYLRPKAPLKYFFATRLWSLGGAEGIDSLSIRNLLR